MLAGLYFPTEFLVFGLHVEHLTSSIPFEDGNAVLLLDSFGCNGSSEATFLPSCLNTGLATSLAATFWSSRCLEGKMSEPAKEGFQDTSVSQENVQHIVQ